MKKRKSESLQLKPIHRFTFGIAGIIFLCTGIVSLLTGRFLYANQRGAMVFAPFGLLIGVVLILAAFARRSGANRK
jgi:hypothetical protein